MKLASVRYADGIGKNGQVKFGGLNQTIGAGDGEIRDMTNLTGNHYPVLATRNKRLLVGHVENPWALFAMNGLFWVSGDKLFYRSKEVGLVTPGYKSFASLGSRVVIFPDKKYYDTETGEFGALEASWQGETLTFGNGFLYGEEAVANAVRCEGVQWSEHGFRAGDCVRIAGCATHPSNNKSAVIHAIDGDILYFAENCFVLDGGDGGGEYTEDGALSICRDVPDMDYVCANDNRLWGCGGDTIYASKFGDIFNWNVFEGLDTDSWTWETGSEGSFTACACYGGYPTFFKENRIFRVYGEVPGSFEAVWSATIGVQQNCRYSLVTAGEALFYLSRSGLMAYTGGSPQYIGNAFGHKQFIYATAGSDGLKYYVCLREQNGSFGLYVYDTLLGLWHREDDVNVIGFANCDGVLYMLSVSGELWIVDPERNDTIRGEWEEDQPFAAEFADFTDTSPNTKTLTKLQIRARVGEGGELRVLVQFDSDGVWLQAGEPITQTRKRSFYLPLPANRCDHYRLKLTGRGDVQVFSLYRELSVGSEMNLKNGRT